jgi:hypothetical protein
VNRNVKLRNPFGPQTTEAQWVRFQYEEKTPIEQIVENVIKRVGKFGPDEESTRLVVEYQLGMRPAGDVEHLLQPKMPSGIEFIAETDDGFLCRTTGTEDAVFDVLMRCPSLRYDQVEELISRNQDEIAFIAYKNAHEGYPFGYSLRSDEKLTHRVALAGISYADIRSLI